MRAVGIEKSESEIVQIILRQLPERYDVVKTMTLANPQLTRSRLETPSVPHTPNARPTKMRNKGRRRVRRRNPRTRMLLSSAVVLGTRGAGAAEANEGTTVWYFAAVACRGSSSSSSSSKGLAALVFLISINVAPMLSLRPGRRDSSNHSSNHSSNRHGESLRSELAESTTAGATPYTSRRVYLPLQAHRCVWCTAVAVGQTWAQVRTLCCIASLAAPAARMFTYGRTALSVAVGNPI